MVIPVCCSSLPWISSHVSRCQVEKNLLLPYKAGVKKSRRMGPKNWPGGRSEAAQHAAVQELSCGESWSLIISPGVFFDSTGALLMPRRFERYLDCSQTPTTEQVLQYVRFEQTHDQEATSRTDMGVSLFMLRASHPAFRPAFCCTDTRPACAKCAGCG